MNSVQSVSLVLALAVAGLTGCQKAEPTNTPSPAPTAQAPGAAAPAAAPSAGEFTHGKVLETMNAGGYTYAHLEGSGTQQWVAGPEMALAVGQQVSVSGGSLMRGFHSNTLGRTFAEIYFVSSMSVVGAGAAAHGGAAPAPNPHGGAPGAAAHGGAAPAPNPHGATPTATVDVAVEPATGGLRIADLFAKKASLVGKPVTVRGKVVKFNAGIMGRNWIHLQDGSGTAGTNDLTVTTDATVSVGDVVTVTGVVATDREFGAGYSYALLVEGAKVQKN